MLHKQAAQRYKGGCEKQEMDTLSREITPREHGCPKCSLSPNPNCSYSPTDTICTGNNQEPSSDPITSEGAIGSSHQLASSIQELGMWFGPRTPTMKTELWKDPAEDSQPPPYAATAPPAPRAHGSDLTRSQAPIPMLLPPHPAAYPGVPG